MVYEENDVLRFIGQQSVGVVPKVAKEQIYDIAKVYLANSDMGFSTMLRFGTDIFILGLAYGKGEMKNELS